MPNPLSKVRPSASVFGGTEALSRHPNLCVYILRVINAWSYSETSFLRMLSGFLSADFAVVTAMFQAIANSEAKRAALLAAARKSAPADHALIQAVLQVTRASRKRRNEFAHHYWADSPEIDNALLLIDPDVILDHHVAYYEHVLTEQKPSAAFPQADKSRVLVFTEADLRKDAEDAERASELISLLEGAVSTVGAEPEKRRLLLADPMIKETLARQQP